MHAISGAQQQIYSTKEVEQQNKKLLMVLKGVQPAKERVTNKSVQNV
jgi:hypothetical protein